MDLVTYSSWLCSSLFYSFKKNIKSFIALMMLKNRPLAQFGPWS